MLPALAPIVAAGEDFGTAALICSSRGSLTVADGVPSDGDTLSAWDNEVPGEPDLQQADPALQPVLRSGIAAGLLAVEFSAQRHLAMPAGDADRFIVLIVNVPASLAGERVLLSRDTTQAGTTKPAYALGLDVA